MISLFGLPPLTGTNWDILIWIAVIVVCLAVFISYVLPIVIILIMFLAALASGFLGWIWDICFRR